MGILRQLSRIPGFNPVPKPSPDREPLPGSANWRKLTPRSTRTKHIDMSGTIDNPFKTLSINKDSHLDTESTSRSIDHAGMSSAKRRAIDRFKDDNPFLAPEDYDRLWDEEIDVARNRMSRESFGQTFSSGVGELLPGDDDTRDLSLAHQDLTDQFFAPTEREVRSPYIGDITGHSAKGFEDPDAHDLAQNQISGVPKLLQGDQDASGTTISAQDSSVLRSADPSDALEDAVRGSGDTAEGPSGEKQRLISSNDVRETGEGGSDQEKDLDVDMNDGWEDIPDDEHTQDFLNQQRLQASATKEPTSGIFGEDDRARENEGQDPLAGQGDVEEAVAMDKEDRDVAVFDNKDQVMMASNDDDQGADLGRLDEQTQGVDEHNLDIDGQLDHADGESLDIDEHNRDISEAAGEQEPVAVHDDEQDREAQNDQEFEDGYMNVNEDDHIEQQEHEEQHGKAGVQYFDDFPSELGIMSNGNILPTSFPKTKKVVRRSRAGVPVPSMPTSLQKQLVHTFSRARMSREAMDVILEGSHLFFEQASNDLAAYAHHSGRKTVDESDVELLMKRLRIMHDKVSMESLLQRYLPRELRDKVLFPEDMPSARRR
ncbi:hypothetical protein BGZ96_006044 [Linnemannia gamsii]|uniref:CENP-T/Histone H4 histone fold domain-containing protein n=1 Tax=Linnemannia gamsii TaxID=64522 RepID=A0ABQ7K320_9FUNG|nr:hypothetical protein BGZ96_006044 [Linnemannia gamsii]